MSDSFDESSNLYDNTEIIADIDNDLENDTKSKKSSKEKPKRPTKAPTGSIFSSSKGSAVEKKPKLNVPLKPPSRPPPPTVTTNPVEKTELKVQAPQKTLLDKTPDEKSAEWWEFQQMQDRISLAVQQSKNTLQKLATTPDPLEPSQEGDEHPSPVVDNDSWTNFDSEGNVVKPKQNFITNAPLLPGIPGLLDDKVSGSNNPQGHLFVSPLPSPLLMPKPPTNSLNVSMDDLTSAAPVSNNMLNLLDFDGSSSVTDSALVGDDLLGFGSGDTKASTQTSTVQPITSDFMKMDSTFVKQDSLGMSLVDDFLGITGEDDKQINPDNKSLDFLSNSFDPLSKPSPTVLPSAVATTETVTNGDLMAYSPDKDFDPFVVKTVIPPHSAFVATTAQKQVNTQTANPFLVSKPLDTDMTLPLTKITNKPVAKPLDPFQVLFSEAKSEENKPEPEVAPDDNATESNLMATRRASVKALLDTGFMRNAEQLSAAAISPIIEPSNAFLSSLTQDDRSPSVNDFDDDDFFSKESGNTAPPVDNAWGFSADTTDSPHSAFVTDDFSNKPLSEFKVEEPVTSQQGNPFLNNEPIMPDSSIMNPFINEAVDLTNKKEPVSDFTIENPPEVTRQLNHMDSFDPFSSKSAEPTSDGAFDPFGINDQQSGEATSPDEFLAAAMSGSDQLVQPDPVNIDDELEDGVFQLKIKPTALSLSSGPVPVLPPPPKTQDYDDETPTRVNPFDNDSPAEENFAEFPVPETVVPAKKKKTESVSSDDTATPEGEVSTEPLPDYHPLEARDGWTLMIRQPTKKKITSNRFWKEFYVRLMMDKGDNPLIKIFTNESQARSNQELPLQQCYSLSDLTLQQYDQYGKIHTFKLQYVFYKERVGLRTERLTPNLSKLVKKPKPTMILDHSPQISELLKFGSMDKELLRSFIWALEDALMNLKCQRDKTLNYTKDEVTMELWDEYEASINKTGHIIEQKARVRIFCLAFLSGTPMCELGVNDRRRKGKEVVGRHDIIPVKTEEWIRMEDVKCHSVVNKEEYEKRSNIKFIPLDSCQFEVMRFRVRLRANLELPLHVSIEQSLDDRHLEIRCNMLVTGFHANTKKYGQFPCENIEVRFPIPEKWIYIFRVEKRFGYGSVKAIARKPGKIKGLERITNLAQSFLSPALMEASTGTAKYEHIYRSVVWRVPRLPERNQGAYTNHVFILKLDLGPHDEIPETFEPHAYTEFTMPASTVSKAQIRSFSVDNQNPPEKWVKYIAKYKYTVEIAHTGAVEGTMSGVAAPTPSGVSVSYGGYGEDSFDRDTVDAPPGDNSDKDSDDSDDSDKAQEVGDEPPVEMQGY